MPLANNKIIQYKYLTDKFGNVKGYPIVGDGKYGINKINKMFNCNHQLLVSYSLKFHFKNINTLYYLNEKEFKLNKLPFDFNNF